MMRVIFGVVVRKAGHARIVTALLDKNRLTGDSVGY
jgi:hypothetical protein